jgi:hypothetical protein
VAGNRVNSRCQHESGNERDATLKALEKEELLRKTSKTLTLMPRTVHETEPSPPSRSATNDLFSATECGSKSAEEVKKLPKTGDLYRGMYPRKSHRLTVEIQSVTRLGSPSARLSLAPVAPLSDQVPGFQAELESIEAPELDADDILPCHNDDERSFPGRFRCYYCVAFQSSLCNFWSSC